MDLKEIKSQTVPNTVRDKKGALFAVFF